MAKRKRNQGLNPFERTIIDVLERARRPLSIRQISKSGNMNWKTADKYVSKLEGVRGISCKRKGNKKMCMRRFKQFNSYSYQ